MDNRYEIAEQNSMSREFADWFFDNKKAGCGNVWFMVMAAMWEGWKGRAALLQGSQPVSNRDELPVIGWLRSDYNIDDKRDSNAPLFMLGRNDPADTWGVKYIPLTGNSPVIQDGWVACSERLPDSDGNYWGWWSESKRQGPLWFIKSELQAQFQSSEITHWMPLPAAPQQGGMIRDFLNIRE